MATAFKDAAAVAVSNYQGADTGYAKRIQFFIGQFGDRDVTSITPEIVETALDALAARGKLQVLKTKSGVIYKPTGQPLSGASRNRYLSSLGTLYRDLRRLRITPRGFVSPTRGVERESGDNARSVNVTVEDVRRLVAACRLSRNKKLAAITAMACTTGWRLGSFQGLRWADIDLENGYADVAKTKNGTPHRAVLLDWVVEEIERIRPARAQPSALVFGPGSFRKAWVAALKLADLPTEWTFHHCRHIAASVLAQSGASVPTIMGLLNHKSPSMALRYSHLNTVTLREGMSRAWA
jgi:integrase